MVRSQHRASPEGQTQGPPRYGHTLFPKQGSWEFSSLVFFFVIDIHVVILPPRMNHCITKTIIHQVPLLCRQS